MRQGHRLQRVGLGLALLCAGALLVYDAGLLCRYARAEQLFTQHQGPDWPQPAYRLDPTWRIAKARYDTRLRAARVLDPQRTVAWSAELLATNPLEGALWADWARAHARAGEPAAAERGYAMALRLNPRNAALLNDAGDFLLEFGDPRQSLALHRRVLELEPRRLEEIALLYRNRGIESAELVGLLPTAAPELAEQLFLRLLPWDSPAAAQRLWQALQPQWDDKGGAGRRAYFDYLIEHQQLAAAAGLWRAILARDYGPAAASDAALFWNGDFRWPLAFNGGLEWRTLARLPEGAAVRIAAGPDVGPEQRGLHLEFDGRHNVAFHHVEHGLLLPRGRYRLRAHARAEQLSTLSGVYLDARLPGERPGTRTSAVVTGTGEQELSIELPIESAQAFVRLVVCRRASTRLDRCIAGRIRLTEFRLERLP